MRGNCSYCCPRSPVTVEPGLDRATNRHVYVCEKIACRVQAILTDVEAQWPRLYAEIRVIDWQIESTTGTIRKTFGQAA